MNFIYSLIGTPLGYIMWALYQVVHNFGVAVILFTFIVKLASMPLTMKQQKNMAISQLFMPRVQEVQAKYKNNQAKLQEEMTKLQKEGYNPMGGCGSMLLVFLILFGVIDVVYKPMTHLEHLAKSEIDLVKEIAVEADYASIILSSPEDTKILLEYLGNGGTLTIDDANLQVVQPEGYKFEKQYGISDADRTKYGKAVKDNLAALTDSKSRISNQIKSELKGVQGKYASLYAEINSLQVYKHSPSAFSTSLTSDTLLILADLSDNMVFLGLDLAQTPRLAFEPLVIIPIFSFVLSMLQMFITQRQQRKTMPNNPAANQASMKIMMWMAPVMSLFISFSVPAGAGLYWGVSYVFGILQTLLTQKFWPADKIREEARQKMEQNKINISATIVDVDEDGKEVVKTEKLGNMSAKEQKEFFRKKLEEARKADLLKYGDVPEDAAYSDKDGKD